MPDQTTQHTARAAAITGKRWCTSCNSEQLEARGTWHESRRSDGRTTRRWLCAGCSTRSSKPFMRKST